MNLLSALGLVGLGSLVGFLIGCVGIGGVLLVPALVYLGQVPVHTAIASAMLSFVFTGLAATYAYWRRGLVPRRAARWLCTGAVPGGFMGAALISVIPELWLKMVVAGAVVFSGIYAIVGSKECPPPRALSSTTLGLVGFGVGVGSSLSGTAGALLLIPVLVWLKVPPVTAVGLSQVISVPIAILATAGNLAFGQVNWLLGITLGLLTILGIELGAGVAARLPQTALRRAVAAMLMISGALMVAQLANR